MQSGELGYVRKFKLDILFLLGQNSVCLLFLLPICLLLFFSTLAKTKDKHPPNSMCLSGSLLVLAPHQSLNKASLFFFLTKYTDSLFHTIE